MDLACFCRNSVDAWLQIWQLVEPLFVKVLDLLPFWLDFEGRLTNTAPLVLALHRIAWHVCPFQCINLRLSLFRLLGSYWPDFCLVILLYLLYLFLEGSSTLVLWRIALSVALFVFMSLRFLDGLKLRFLCDFNQLRLCSFLSGSSCLSLSLILGLRWDHLGCCCRCDELT